MQPKIAPYSTLDLAQCDGPVCDRLIDHSLRENLRVNRALLATLTPKIAAVAHQIARAFSQGNKVLLIGNGGSAADAQHIAAELVGRFEQDHPPWSAIALTTDTSVLTALINDYGNQSLFARQIEGLGQTGDILLALSTSGDSENVLAGVQAALAQGLQVIGLTGQSGGQLAQHCDLVVQVPSTRTARIQEAHALIGHLICESVEALLSPDSETIVGGHPPDFSPVKLLVLDFDGVLTDNRVLVDQNGTEAVWCHRGDGWGIARLREQALEVLVLSTEPNPVVQARCTKLHLECIHGCNDKLTALNALIEARSLTLEQVAYVGNDVNDLACMEQVGFPIAVADAVPEILTVACWVTQNPGGYGAVREVADLLQAALPVRVEEEASG